ncbi:hypothetical protein JTE90_007040 [Oedothorax gibbosus]|uniref:Uncharacterized protein n=1 Tax=Oedothorax gibbosus TaxID=931172 RepID=A0AAV6U7D1_9ARAC|nr:hypothetical protein JTE90_007040 [Oedothorax gibbosus]
MARGNVRPLSLCPSALHTGVSGSLSEQKVITFHLLCVRGSDGGLELGRGGSRSRFLEAEFSPVMEERCSRFLEVEVSRLFVWAEGVNFNVGQLVLDSLRKEKTLSAHANRMERERGWRARDGFSPIPNQSPKSWGLGGRGNTLKGREGRISNGHEAFLMWLKSLAYEKTDAVFLPSSHFGFSSVRKGTDGEKESPGNVLIGATTLWPEHALTEGQSSSCRNVRKLMAELLILLKRRKKRNIRREMEKGSP